MSGTPKNDRQQRDLHLQGSARAWQHQQSQQQQAFNDNLDRSLNSNKDRSVPNTFTTRSSIRSVSQTSSGSRPSSSIGGSSKVTTEPSSNTRINPSALSSSLSGLGSGSTSMSSQSQGLSRRPDSGASSNLTPTVNSSQCRICRKLITEDESYHLCSNCNQFICEDCASYSYSDQVSTIRLRLQP